MFLATEEAAVNAAPAVSFPTWTRWDALSLGSLAVFNLGFRLNTLAHPTLNPDESQYQATAAYLIVEGLPSFSATFGPTYLFAIYRTVAEAFGPYHMLPVRLIIAIISTVMSWLIYDIVRPFSQRSLALLAGVLFLALNPFYEGYSANAEWFSGLSLFVGLWLAVRYRRPDRRQPILGFALGALCATSVWLKLQALPASLALPCVTLLRLRIPTERQGAVNELSFFALGYGIAGILGAVPFLWTGSLQSYLSVAFQFASQYTLAERGQATRTDLEASSTAALYLRFLLTEHSFRLPWLLAYGMMLLGATAPWRPAAAGYAETEGVWRRRALFLLAVMHVFHLIGIQLGRRFYGHYFLYLLPTLCILASLAADCWRDLIREQRRSRLRFFLLGTSLFVLLLPYANLLARDAWPGRMPTLLLGCMVATFAGVAMRCPWRQRRVELWIVNAVLVLMTAEVVLLLSRTQTTDFEMYDLQRIEPVAAELRAKATPDDRLHVWGWRPEIYVLSRLAPASQFVIAQYVVEDYNADARRRPAAEAVWRRFFDELSRSQPRWFVDATEISVAMGSKSLYRIPRYPRLRSFLESAYQWHASVGGCLILVRRVQAFENPAAPVGGSRAAAPSTEES